MDYENLYKDAVSKIKSIIADKKKQGLTNCLFEGDLNEIFPELAESKDEMIRKELIRLLNVMTDGIVENYTTTPLRDFIAWLDKQDEKQDYNPYKATIESIAAMVEKYANGDLKDFYDNIKVKCKDAMEYDKTWNKKQGEQKSNKIEQKFKIGDWITFYGSEPFKILEVAPEQNGILNYLLLEPSGNNIYYDKRYVDENARLWIIKDAKAGDILVYEGEIFMIKSYALWNKVVYHCCYDGKNLHKDSVYYSWGKEDFDKVHPATKEQRDLLFQKMKEAGYEWDENKKILVMIGIDNDVKDERYEELMKDNETDLNIKQNSANSYCRENCKGYQETGKCYADGECKAKRDAKQKPAWSDDDEKMMQCIHKYVKASASNFDYDNIQIWFRNLKKRVQPQQKQEWSESDEKILKQIDSLLYCQCTIHSSMYEKLHNWLKSLKPQPHWKPTGEQLNALKQISENDYIMYQTTLKSLYNDLKKL